MDFARSGGSFSRSGGHRGDEDGARHLAAVSKASLSWRPLKRRATLYATARGFFGPAIERSAGQRGSVHAEWTDYNKRLHYRTFDVTSSWSRVRMLLGAMLGDGWWSGFIGWQETRGQYGRCRTACCFSWKSSWRTARRVVIPRNDSSWRCETGPILSGDFMMGETYDARRERKGWDQAGFDDSNWLPASKSRRSQGPRPRVRLLQQSARRKREPVAGGSAIRAGASRGDPSSSVGERGSNRACSSTISVRISPAG